MASPFGFLQKAFSSERRAAIRVVTPHLNSSSGALAADALNDLATLTDPRLSAATVIAGMPPSVDNAATALASAIAAAEKVLCNALPAGLDTAMARANTCAADRDGAYRAARMREIEASAHRLHLGDLLPLFVTLPPTS